MTGSIAQWAFCCVKVIESVLQAGLSLSPTRNLTTPTLTNHPIPPTHSQIIMAVVKWGIDDPENSRNKENLELSQQLEEERRSFVGTATKGAIRTNPDESIMSPKTEEQR